MTMQQTVQLSRAQMNAKQIAIVLAQKTDLELKEEFPVFWELLKLKRKKEELD